MRCAVHHASNARSCDCRASSCLQCVSFLHSVVHQSSCKGTLAIYGHGCHAWFQHSIQQGQNPTRTCPFFPMHRHDHSPFWHPVFWGVAVCLPGQRRRSPRSLSPQLGTSCVSQRSSNVSSCTWTRPPPRDRVPPKAPPAFAVSSGRTSRPTSTRRSRRPGMVPTRRIQGRGHQVHQVHPELPELRTVLLRKNP